MDVTEAIMKRKSIRAYEDRPVSADLVAKIVEAGQWAPNAGPFQISVITKAGLRRKINDGTLDAMINAKEEFPRQRAALPGYQPLYGAPVLFLLSAPAGPMAAVNAALAAENMLIEATGLGLGSCYLMSPTRILGTDSGKELLREAGVPEGYAVQCGIIVGHAATENKFSPLSAQRKGP